MRRRSGLTFYTKLLPPLVAGNKDSPLSVIHRIERIIVEHHTLANNGRLRFGAVGSLSSMSCFGPAVVSTRGRLFQIAGISWM